MTLIGIRRIGAALRNAGGGARGWAAEHEERASAELGDRGGQRVHPAVGFPH